MEAYFDRFSIKMTLAEARSASHPGPNDEDVLALSRVPKIARQLERLDPADVRDELSEYTDWDVSDHEENLQRILWIAAGNIVEEAYERGKR